MERGHFSTEQLLLGGTHEATESPAAGGHPFGQARGACGIFATALFIGNVGHDLKGGLPKNVKHEVTATHVPLINDQCE